LHNVFEVGEQVTDALRNLNIRHSTFERWLTKPVFLNKLRMYLNQYYLQARLELARSAPSAVSGLSFITEKSHSQVEIRKACADLLHLHTQIAKSAASNPSQPSPYAAMPERKNGHVMDKNGATMEQFGFVLEHNGILSDKVCNEKTTKNSLPAQKTQKIPQKNKYLVNPVNPV
jgi:hypothetical protein